MLSYDTAITFACGAAYGFTSVVVGQPLDTIKTRMQARPSNLSSNALATGMEVFRTEGVRGLYRGGLPLIVGGTFMRSAQFGCYDATMKALRKHELLDFKVAGVFDPAVVVAGFVGGMGRGVVEGPFEFVKVRRQLDKPWNLSSVYKGSSATMVRNAFLFGSFVVYIDLSKQAVDGGLGPFWTGAVCSNLAWLTIWPLDVVKVKSGTAGAGRVRGGCGAGARRAGMGRRWGCCGGWGEWSIPCTRYGADRVAKHGVDRSQKEAAAALAVAGGGG